LFFSKIFVKFWKKSEIHQTAFDFSETSEYYFCGTDSWGTAHQKSKFILEVPSKAEAFSENP
jgi:hypothetical protein